METGSKSDPRARQEVIRRIRGELTNLVEISAVQSLPAAEFYQTVLTVFFIILLLFKIQMLFTFSIIC